MKRGYRYKNGKTLNNDSLYPRFYVATLLTYEQTDDTKCCRFATVCDRLCGEFGPGRAKCNWSPTHDDISQILNNVSASCLCSDFDIQLLFDAVKTVAGKRSTPRDLLKLWMSSSFCKIAHGGYVMIQQNTDDDTVDTRHQDVLSQMDVFLGELGLTLMSDKQKMDLCTSSGFCSMIGKHDDVLRKHDDVLHSSPPLVSKR